MLCEAWYSFVNPQPSPSRSNFSLQAGVSGVLHAPSGQQGGRSASGAVLTRRQALMGTGLNIGGGASGGSDSSSDGGLSFGDSDSFDVSPEVLW